MAYKGEACVRTFLVWDVANEEPEAGLDPETDLAMRLIADGIADDAGGDISEVENGLYSIEISAAENDAECLCVEGTCTEPDCIVIPVQWTNNVHPLKGILEDLDGDDDSAAWAILTMLKSLIGNVRTTEGEGGATRIIYEGAIGGTARATSTIAQAGDVTEKTKS